MMKNRNQISSGKDFNRLIAIVFSLTTLACGNDLDSHKSSLAAITINNVQSDKYDSYAIQLIPNGEESNFSMTRQRYENKDGIIKLEVPSGDYRIVFEVFQSYELVYSADFCTSSRNNEVRLMPGSNQIQLNVCMKAKSSVDPDPIFEPSLIGETFYIENSQLYDKSGRTFIMRGVNNPHAYFRTPSYGALEVIKDYGFNSVRIVWCADNLSREGRCEQKDMHGLEHLEAILARMRQLKLVAVLNLQNATGSDDPLHLALLVDWYTRPEVKRVLLDYQDILIINIANEWFGSWQDPKQIYLRTYQEQILRIRAAGLPHVLIIDARGWGQQFESIPQNFKEIMKVDQNLMFSAHFYDVFDQAEKVRQAFSKVRELKIPFLVGEFACVHYPGQRVDCDTVMAESNRSDAPVGYLAWSWSGNSDKLSDLNVAEYSDWRSLSQWGRRLVHGNNGIQSTSRQACFFDQKQC